MAIFNAGTMGPRKPLPNSLRFELGRIVVTPGAATEIPDAAISESLYRHQRGDWGSVDSIEQRCNEEVLKLGGWLLSAYDVESGIRFLIITQPDRMITTVMLPDEF